MVQVTRARSFCSAEGVADCIVADVAKLQTQHDGRLGGEGRVLIGIIQYKIVIESPVSHDPPSLAFVIFESAGCGRDHPVKSVV
jgi:hypothetical protein